MFPPELIAALRQREIDAEWTQVIDGSLTVEAPAVIKHLHSFGRCAFGAFSYSDERVALYSTDVGRYCSIAYGVRINISEHPTDQVSTHPMVHDLSGHAAGMAQMDSYRGVTGTGEAILAGGADPVRGRIGNDVWIGANALILQGVLVGDGAVIGAGSVVTRDVEPYAVVAGSPAREIRKRFSPETVAMLRASEWWRFDLSKLGRRDYHDPEAFVRHLAQAQPPVLRPTPIVLTPS